MYISCFPFTLGLTLLYPIKYPMHVSKRFVACTGFLVCVSGRQGVERGEGLRSACRVRAASGWPDAPAAQSEHRRVSVGSV